MKMGIPGVIPEITNEDSRPFNIRFLVHYCVQKLRMLYLLYRLYLFKQLQNYSKIIQTLRNTNVNSFNFINDSLYF